MENKYSRSIDARRRADAERATADLVEKHKQEAEKWERRADEAVAKAEYAYEVLRAILPELRRGRPVSKPALAKAWDRLADIPDHFKRDLTPDDGPLDRELRKDDPNKK